MAEDKTAIYIDDTEYALEDMTPEQQTLVNHVADLDRKIRSSKFNLDQLEFGRAAFMERLKTSLASENER